MKATQQLTREHELIIDALTLLGLISERLTVEDTSAQEHLSQLLHFFRDFADRRHHAKEEEILFPAMESRGVPRERGPIGVMLSEHEEGRRLVGEISAALAQLQRGEPSALKIISSNARELRRLLEAHISKENNILFPMADRLLQDVAPELWERFIEADRAHSNTSAEVLQTLKAEYARPER